MCAGLGFASLVSWTSASQIYAGVEDMSRQSHLIVLKRDSYREFWTFCSKACLARKYQLWQLVTKKQTKQYETARKMWENKRREKFQERPFESENKLTTQYDPQISPVLINLRSILRAALLWAPWISESPPVPVSSWLDSPGEAKLHCQFAVVKAYWCPSMVV